MAMEEFRKAAKGGNCVAMMAIAELYSNGKGVPADKAQVQNWNAKAESCQNGNLAVLQQQITEYQTRAAGAREPATRSILSAIPVLPRTAPRASRNGQQSSVGWSPDFLGDLVAAAVTLTAINLLLPDSGGASDQATKDEQTRVNIDLDWQKWHCIPTGVFQSPGDAEKRSGSGAIGRPALPCSSQRPNAGRMSGPGELNRFIRVVGDSEKARSRLRQKMAVLAPVV